MELNNADLWTRGPSLTPTYVRNEIDNGYTATEIGLGTTDIKVPLSSIHFYCRHRPR